MELYIKHGKSITWEQFLNERGSSIALDGFVTGGPNYSHKTKHVNFDHHDGVVREATMSSCKQVMFAIKGDIFDHFKWKDTSVYINDCDQDVIMSIWLLRNYKQFSSSNSNPIINRMLSLVDEMDISAGAFNRNYCDELMNSFNWVFKPYYDARAKGIDDSVIELVVDACCHRITQYMLGNGKTAIIDGTFETISHSSYGYKVFKDENKAVHLSNGTKAYVSLVRKVDDKYTWTIGRKSRYVDFPVDKILGRLNEIEPGWGGSDLVGGSPRDTGSKLGVATLMEIIDNVLRR